jgi:hypothetical protein
MNPSDAPLEMQPQFILDLQFRTHPSNIESRLTFQNFKCDDPFTRVITPHNSVAKRSTHEDWPPRFVLDIAYSSAALKARGATEFVKFAEEQAQRFYYHNGTYDDDGENNRGPGRQRLVIIRHLMFLMSSRDCGQCKKRYPSGSCDKGRTNPE